MSFKYSVAYWPSFHPEQGKRQQELEGKVLQTAIRSTLKSVFQRFSVSRTPTTSIITYVEELHIKIFAIADR